MMMKLRQNEQGNLYLSVCWYIRKTVDKNVLKSTGMSRVSSCESACVRVCLITSSIPILDPRVSHLFCAICHIYYSHISDMQYFFIYYIYIYILVTSMSDPWAYGHRIISHHSAMLHLRNIYIHIYHTVKI